jgi:hypothetical protein
MNKAKVYSADESVVHDTKRRSLCAIISDSLAHALPPQSSVDVHDLRKTGAAQVIAVSFMGIYLTFLLYGSISGYRQLRREAFLSPDLYAGECNEEPITLTSVYNADSKGLWETQKGFVSTRSIYALDLEGTSVTTDKYPEVMKHIMSRFEEEAEKCTRRDLSYSMIALASFNVADEETKMNFYTNARAEKVFGSVLYTSSIANGDSICDTPYSAVYDPETSSVRFKIKFQDPSDGDWVPCEQLVSDDFDLKDIDDDGYKTVKFDVRSIATAVAINIGMTRVAADLVKMEDPLGYFDYDGFVFYQNENFLLSFYVDSFYDNMIPILCFDGSKYDKGDYCFIQDTHGTLFYPMITQYGHWWTEKMCTCGEEGTVHDEDMAFYCSQADYFVSLVYVPEIDQNSDDDDSVSYGDNQTNYGDDQVTYGDDQVAFGDAQQILNENSILSGYTITDFAETMAAKIYDDTKNGDFEITKLFHPAQFRSVMNMGSLLDAFQDLCHGKCTLLTVEFWGSTTSPMNFRGTPVYSMFENTAMIACANGLYRPEAFAPLVNKPPVTLVQGYYTCVPNRTVAIQRAVGISAGSAALYSSIALNFLLFTVVFFYNLFADEKIVNLTEKKRNMEVEFEQLKREVVRIARVNEELEKKINIR